MCSIRMPRSGGELSCHSPEDHSQLPPLIVLSPSLEVIVILLRCLCLSYFFRWVCMYVLFSVSTHCLFSSSFTGTFSSRIAGRSGQTILTAVDLYDAETHQWFTSSLSEVTHCLFRLFAPLRWFFVCLLL